MLILCFFSCEDTQKRQGKSQATLDKTKKQKNKYLTYQNIIMLTDMSSRISNKPLKDNMRINELLTYFKDTCVKPGQKMGDRSCISFSTFSSGEIIKIDLDKYKNIGKRQRYINSKSEFSNKGFIEDLKMFNDKIQDVYNKTKNPGLDLISLLIEKLENGSIIKRNSYKSFKTDTTFLNFENHVYIFTDGYLEYKNKHLNDQFYFGAKEINRLRKYCKKKEVSIQKALDDNPDFKLKPYLNKQNSNIELHLLETHERDKDEITGTYLNPIGLRDNEILETVWKNWAIDSGFKGIDWKKY